MDTHLENWAFKKEIMNPISDEGKRWNWKDLGASVWGRLVLIMLFTPSPSRLEKQDLLESHSGKCVLWMLQYTMLSWLKTAVGPGPLEPVQCGVLKECVKTGGFGSQILWITEKYSVFLEENVSPVPLAGLVQNMF